MLEQRLRLARLEPGGSPEHPESVVSAAVVETRAVTEPCLSCGSRVRLVEHRAETHGGRRLRVTLGRCASCGLERTRYFEIASVLPN